MTSEQTVKEKYPKYIFNSLTMKNDKEQPETPDYDAICNGCGIGISEIEIKYTNDEGHDYCNDCNEAIQSDDESSGRLNKAHTEFEELLKRHGIFEYDLRIYNVIQELISQHSCTEQKWVSVEDRLPDEGGRYLCYVSELNDLGTSHFVCNCYFDDRDSEFRDSHQKMHVTHWMPLPKPPTEQSGTTPPTYTQEQMIAFGEAVLKEAAEQAKQIWDHNNYWGSKPIINKQSILSIDISKLLNK